MDATTAKPFTELLLVLTGGVLLVLGVLESTLWIALVGAALPAAILGGQLARLSRGITLTHISAFVIFVIGLGALIVSYAASRLLETAWLALVGAVMFMCCVYISSTVSPRRSPSVDDVGSPDPAQ